MPDPIRVWDLPLRLFKWGLVISIAGSFLSINAGEMEWHARFGFCAIALVLFRIVWGIVGSETARFTSFVKGPAAVLAYLREKRWRGVGHNPLGALSVLALLGVVLIQASLGVFANDDIFFDGPWAGAIGKETSDWLTGWHHRLSKLVIGLIALHFAVVIWHSATGDDLIRPMLTGRKRSDKPEPRQVSAWIALPVAALAVFVAGLAMRYWIT